MGAVGALRVDQTVVERMRDRLTHRGPDAAGIWSSPDGRVCLGHRRLAIVDLSRDADQPFVSQDGRYAVTYNGELYNFRALRHELERLGSRFRTQSDTEVLLEAYRHWGVASLDRLNGMFAFAIWDEARRELVCARDRAGEKPFHYAVVDGAFVFASELKSLLLWPGFERRLDHAALGEFLTFGAIPDPRTVWTGASKLPAASILAVGARGDGVRVGEPASYWDLALEPEDLDLADWEERLRTAVVDSAREMSYADVPVGTFLSGGLDSSSVTAALARDSLPVESFTIGFDDPDFDERPYAEAVARHVRAPHRSRTVDAADVEAVFRDTILWHYDEPFNDYSYLPTYYVAREARRFVTVALTGDGADEMFGGYGKYRLLARRAAVEQLIGRPATQLAAVGARTVLPRTTTLRGRLLRYEQSASAMLGSLLTTAFEPADLRVAARGELADALEHHDPFAVVERHLRAAPVADVGLVNAMRYLDLKMTLGAGILTKVDRASMAVSLETRPVFLHRSLLDLAGRIPPRLLASGSEAKKVLRSAFRPWLPAVALDRPKQGFAMPLGQWLRDEVALRLDRRFDERPISQLVAPELVHRLAAEHASGLDRTSKLHSLLFLDQWLERWA
ncbi:MAG TPA: asparagine synthase (glutamine-hydrolyzing) [Gaiellaceae bacterium]|nr:asparagine synthase (glutamine-hydrolyzing) [Gaiellaceae bacterium]